MCLELRKKKHYQKKALGKAKMKLSHLKLWKIHLHELKPTIFTI